MVTGECYHLKINKSTRTTLVRRAPGTNHTIKEEPHFVSGCKGE